MKVFSRLLAACAVVLALMFAALTAPAMAKTVFITYDTSGSMEARKHLPAFAASVLASTLDGRPGQDRLFTLTFDDFFAAARASGLPEDSVPILTADNVQQFTSQLANPVYRLENMADLALQTRTVNALNSRFSTVRKGTPYGAIEVSLDAIARETVAGEDVHLIIVTDGAFNDPPDPATVEASIREHRDRIKSDVRVTYVLILPSEPGAANDARALLDNVEAQGIKDALLSVFNEDADSGFYAVDSGIALWSALKNIIAQIAATDLTEFGRYVSYSGNEVRIDTPFSITRIISVATSPDGAPAALVSSSLGGQPDEIATRMLGPDSDFPGLLFQGVTSQYRFVPAIAPGQHVLGFDGPTEEGVFLLFDTNVVASVDILDAETGAAVPRDATGAAMLELGRTYQLQTVLSDPGSMLRTDFDDLDPSSAFTVEVKGGAQTEVVVLERDADNDRAIGTFVADETGTFSASAQVRLPGFVSPRSADLSFVVVDREMVLTLAEERPVEACAACGTGELQSSVTLGEGVTEVVSYDIAVAGEAPGAVKVELVAGADLIEIVDEGGNVIASGTEISVQPGETLTLRLRRQPLDAGFLATATSSAFGLVVTPVAPAMGAALEISRDLRLMVPTATITLVSYAKGDPADGPLALNEVELQSGKVGADLLVEGTLAVPDATTISVAPAPPAVWIDRRNWFWEPVHRVDGYVVNTAPKAGVLSLFWLEAASWVFGREVFATVSYRDALGLQFAEAQVPMTFTVGWPMFFVSLGLNLGVLLLVLYLLRVGAAIFNVSRFPPHSVLEESEIGRNRPKRHELRRSWLATYPLVLLAPFRGAPRETKEIRGLRFEADRGRARLVLPKGKVPGWIVGGTALSKLREHSPKLSSVPVQWGDVLVDERDRDHTLRMVRDRRQAT